MTSHVTWRPPAGWTVTTIERGARCYFCSRNLATGDTALANFTPRRPQFRCVDTDDCDSVAAWGSEPNFRARHTRVARQRDRQAGRT